jgi:hypothetical protein
MAMRTHVEHPVHGAGRVVSLRRGGHLALVEFEALALPTLIPTRELTTLQPSAHAIEPASATLAPTVRGTREPSAALLTLEAMRLGVVPARDLDAYTVGREVELTRVRQDLDQTSRHGGQVRVFLADYGVGKTHLLELVEQTARERNFLTARVVLDATELSPSHPRRVFHGLVRSLRYPDRPHDEHLGLGPLLERALASEAVRTQFALDAWKHGAANEALLEAGVHLYLTPALRYLETLASNNEPTSAAPANESPDPWGEQARHLLLSWIEGHPTASNQEIIEHFRAQPGARPHLYSLKDYRPWARIYSYLLSGLSTLARLSGYEGLVVLFDEAELYALLSRENREHARNVFKAISLAALGSTAVAFDADDLRHGGYGILQALPPRYGDAPGLYAVFAMTPNAEGNAIVEQIATDDQVSELEQLSSRDYRYLTRQVCDFYASASLRWAPGEDEAARIEAVLVSLYEAGHVANPRQAMKAIIELLDICRYHPERAQGALRNLQNLASF